MHVVAFKVELRCNIYILSSFFFKAFFFFFINPQSWKNQIPPAELRHEADDVPGCHRGAVPSGTLAKGARGPEQSASQG